MKQDMRLYYLVQWLLYIIYVSHSLFIWDRAIIQKSVKNINNSSVATNSSRERIETTKSVRVPVHLNTSNSETKTNHSATVEEVATVHIKTSTETRSREVEPTKTMPVKELPKIEQAQVQTQPPTILQDRETTGDTAKHEKASKSNKNIIESGALYRSFYVFFGLSFVGIAYFMYRSYRSGRVPSNIVHKYGVRTNRNDLEMAPLPISDADEEEDVLYEKKIEGNQQSQLNYYDYNNITTYEIK